MVRFGELWLRGKNRGTYVNGLRANLVRMLGGIACTVRLDYDKIVIEPKTETDTKRVKDVLDHLFGISRYEVAYRSEPSVASITKLAIELLKRNKPKSVKINAHRAHKGFKFNSIDITKSIAHAAEKNGVLPLIHGFESEIFINVSKDYAYVSMDTAKGLGGLPVGSSGKGVVLISGGIDSPVAAWYAMKRGITPIYVHFHGFSSADEAINSKMSGIFDELSKYDAGCKIYYIPTHVFQMAAMRAGKYELILLKAFMLRVAEMIAIKEGAEAIFTGESLGQVASQTTSNLLAAQFGLKMQILRPLIGFDKQEIISKAREMGTYANSVIPYKDVCSINARNPATRTDPFVMKDLIRKFKVASLARRSLKLAKIVEK